MITYEDFIKKFKNKEPLRCYTELVTVEDCLKCKCGLNSEFPCPFKVLLEELKEKSEKEKIFPGEPYKVYLSCGHTVSSESVSWNRGKGEAWCPYCRKMVKAVKIIDRVTGEEKDKL